MKKKAYRIYLNLNFRKNIFISCFFFPFFLLYASFSSLSFHFYWLFIGIIFITYEGNENNNNHSSRRIYTETGISWKTSQCLIAVYLQKKRVMKNRQKTKAKRKKKKVNVIDNDLFLFLSLKKKKRIISDISLLYCYHHPIFHVSSLSLSLSTISSSVSSSSSSSQPQQNKTKIPSITITTTTIITTNVTTTIIIITITTIISTTNTNIIYDEYHLCLLVNQSYILFFCFSFPPFPFFFFSNELNFLITDSII